MSDNRVTTRLPEDLLSKVDSERLGLSMSRADFVRYCVQLQLAFMAKRESRMVKKYEDEISLLKRGNNQLLEENQKLREYLD